MIQQKWEGYVFFARVNRAFVVALVLFGAWGVSTSPKAFGQEELTRKVKYKVAPGYPELARKMNIAGVVKVLVTVAPNGVVKDAKLMGGHPVLATAAIDAVRKWKYEAAPEETAGIVEFRFDPNQ
jgi:TonB family protein